MWEGVEKLSNVQYTWDKVSPPSQLLIIQHTKHNYTTHMTKPSSDPTILSLAVHEFISIQTTVGDFLPSCIICSTSKPHTDHSTM